MPTPHLVLTRRFADAVFYAADLHRDQARKDTTIPYLSHLLGAAAFVMEQEGTTEDQAIAALLHDAIEDQPDRTTFAGIEEQFGADVATIVRDCTDAEVHPKPPWKKRKVEYLAHLEQAPVASLQVSLADKLHNARAILTDLQTIGPQVWDRFNAPSAEQGWYYTSLAEVFVRRLDSPTAHALGATVEAIVAHIPEGTDD
ncbi:MAG: HD domain-containing protein [Euzebya sp.]